MRKKTAPDADSAAGEPGESTRTKKPYQAPRLAVYGDLRHIAMVKGGTKADGGKGSPATKA
jgi:hypothetical protein